MPVCKFNDIAEKDMDLLILEEFVASQEFANIFLGKVSLENAIVKAIEHSKMSIEYGESDLTIIVERNGNKHGLLIEDKIDAIAMPNQANRYFERGKQGVKTGDYDDFDVFIVAPEKYLKENQEAKKYPNCVTYEEIAEYFSLQIDARAEFKYQMIMQAIHKQKTGYQVKEDEDVTAFWDSYIDYQKRHYPELWLTTTKGAKAATSTWAYFRTVIKNVLIYHKCEKGYMDLTFPNKGENIVAFEKMLEKAIGELKSLEAFVVKTGKAAALRLEVPIIDVRSPFEESAPLMDTCLQAAGKLNEIAKKIESNKEI